MRSWPCPRDCRARPLCCQPSVSEPQPWLRTAAGQGCEKRPGEAGESSRGWPRAQPPARPARQSRPAPSAPAGALTPILLRKHLLGFKVTRPPFRHGENKTRASPQHASGWQGKKYAKSRGNTLEETPRAGETLPARTAPQPSAPHGGAPRHRGPRRSFRETARNSCFHSAACPQPLLIIITPPKITIAVTTTAIIAVKNSNSNTKGKKKGFRGTGDEEGQEDGEPVPCRISRGSGDQPEGN